MQAGARAKSAHDTNDPHNEILAAKPKHSPIILSGFMREQI
jgi:hypothetical protein